MIRCCYGCVPPKRYPACHDHCPEYKADKEAYEAEKLEREKYERTSQSIYIQRSRAVIKAYKKHGGKHG